MKYDFFVAGRIRNHENIREVLELVRASGSTAYCFIENQYKGEIVEFTIDGDVEPSMARLESLPQNDSFVNKIFETDMKAERESAAFLLVLPAGISGHIEAGVAYGLAKPCYAIGNVDKTETLYGIFDEIFPDKKALEKWLDTRRAR